MKEIMDLIEEGKVKGYFKVRNKYSFEGAISHVTQHASGTEPLFIHSRTQNCGLQAADRQWPLSISLKETADFRPRSFIKILWRGR